MRVVHNITIGSDYVPSEGKYMHLVKCVVSDLASEGPVEGSPDMAQRKLVHSQELRLNVNPMMEPAEWVGALRAYADSIEEYLNTPEHTDEVG